MHSIANHAEDDEAPEAEGVASERSGSATLLSTELFQRLHSTEFVIIEARRACPGDRDLAPDAYAVKRRFFGRHGLDQGD